MRNRFILIEDPEDPDRQLVSEYTPAEMQAAFSAFELAQLEEGGTILREGPAGKPQLMTDMLAFIGLAMAAQRQRVLADIASGDSPLRRQLRNRMLRHQATGAG